MGVPMVLSKFRLVSSKVSSMVVPMVVSMSTKMSGLSISTARVMSVLMSEAEAVGASAMQKSIAIERIAKMFFIKTVLRIKLFVGVDNGFYFEKTKSFGTSNETCLEVVLIGTGFPLESM